MKNLKSVSFLLMLSLFALYIGCQHKDNKEINVTPPQTTTTENNDAVKLNEMKSEQISPGVLADITDEKKKTITVNEKSAQNINVTKRMVVKSGTMGIEIEKFDEAAVKVNDITKKFGGYISKTTSSQNNGGKKQGTLTIKVPADKYEDLISEISGIGKVMSQNISSNDITEEYIDLEARLKTQKELEERLLKLLADKTARLTDVVEVEQKLASVRQVIESIDGKMRYMRNQSEMSTLTLSLYEPAILTTSSGGGFFYELGQSIKKGLRGFTDVLAGMITVIIALLPIIVLIIIIYWIIRRIIKKRKQKLSS